MALHHFLLLLLVLPGLLCDSEVGSTVLGHMQQIVLLGMQGLAECDVHAASHLLSVSAALEPTCSAVDLHGSCVLLPTVHDVGEALQAQRAANPHQPLPVVTQQEMLERMDGSGEFQAMPQLWLDVCEAKPTAAFYNPFCDAELQGVEAHSQQVRMPSGTPAMPA